MGRKLVVAAILMGIQAGAAGASQKSPSLAGLARAMAAEKHCNTLLATERLELERTTEARRLAETAAAADVARQMYDEGSATGAKARCDETTARAIKSVLLASRVAIPAKPDIPAIAVTTASTKVPEPAPAAMAEVKQRTTIKPTVLKKPVRKVQQQAPASLASYGSMVESYYRELRCPTMSTSSVNGFYREVMRAHQKAVRDFGVGAASTAVRRAEARANAGSC